MTDRVPRIPSFTLTVRRIHMYLALFLAPWALMYALSTAAMNHRHFFEDHYGERGAPFRLERQLVYDGAFSADLSPRLMARQLLRDLDLGGAHYARGGRDGRPLTIWREAPLWVRKITYRPEDNSLRIEKQEFRTPVVLEELHRRSGYAHDYALEDLWGAAVDLMIVAMVFWVLSGLWLWWELKATRYWGGLCLGVGVGLFAFFLAMI